VSVDLQLDRPGGCGPAEWRSYVCGSLAWQALGAQACRVDIGQAWAGLESTTQQNGDHACVYLRRGRPWGYGSVLIMQAFVGLEGWPSRTEIVHVCISSVAGLGGVAWQRS
jgi:hypothetical protein